MKHFKSWATVPALAIALSAGVAGAAPIMIESQNFSDVDTASSTEVTFGGGGIPTDPVAWSEFAVGDDTLILGLGAHGRYSNPDVSIYEPNVYGAVAGFNNLGEPSALKGATWNFNWFAEIIPATGSNTTLKDLGLELLYDLDPSADTDETDHGVIDLSTLLAGVDPSALVTQSSQNATFGFLQPGNSTSVVTPPSTAFDPFAAGSYTFALRSNQGSVGIEMNVVPLPAAGWMLLTAFGGLGLVARRRRKAA